MPRLHLSFAWTTPAVLAGFFQPDLPGKTETRRDWKPSTIKRFQNALDEAITDTGFANQWRDVDEPEIDLLPVCCQAWTKQRWMKGAEHFATIIVHSITPNERQGDIPDDAWHREGFGLLSAIGAKFEKGTNAFDVWDYWRVQSPDELQTVIKFSVLMVTEAGHRIWRELEEKHSSLLRERPDYSRHRKCVGCGKPTDAAWEWELDARPIPACSKACLVLGGMGASNV